MLMQVGCSFGKPQSGLECHAVLEDVPHHCSRCIHQKVDLPALNKTCMTRGLKIRMFEYRSKSACAEAMMSALWHVHITATLQTFACGCITLHVHPMASDLFWVSGL